MRLPRWGLSRLPCGFVMPAERCSILRFITICAAEFISSCCAHGATLSGSALAISMLMVLWLLLRSIKFSIANTDAERWLWYFYYVPILFIPMLSVFVSQSLGKPEDFHLPRWTKLLYVPTVLLLLLVLTNDLHQRVFSFPSGILSDAAYRYERGYFFVLGWELFCAALSLSLRV